MILTSAKGVGGIGQKEERGGRRRGEEVSSGQSQLVVLKAKAKAKGRGERGRGGDVAKGEDVEMWRCGDLERWEPRSG